MRIEFEGDEKPLSYPAIMQYTRNQGFIVIANEDNSAYVLRNGNTNYKCGEMVPHLCSNAEHWKPYAGKITLRN